MLSYNHILPLIKKCKTVTGKISIVMMPDSLKQDIKQITNFLPDERAYAERIYCINNNIHKVPICPITKQQLRWNPNRKCYSKSKTDAYKNRIIKHPADLKDIYTSNKHNIIDKFKHNNYLLYKKEEIITWYKSRGNKSITPASYPKYSDLICSIIYYTPFLYIDTTSHLRIGERIYCIKNNITSDQNKKYINSILGYQRYTRRQQGNVTRNKIQEEIEKQDFEFMGWVDSDAGYIHRAKLSCKKCNTLNTPLIFNGRWQKIYCPGCFGDTGRSKIEEDIAVWLEGYNIQCIRNDIKILNGFEIDIYLPKYKIGIELCGILWHSYGTKYPVNAEHEKYKKHHMAIKTKTAQNLGISIITIFDSEWTQKPDIVKSIILSKLGITQKIFARKTQFKKIENNVAANFFQDNHLQGSAGSLKDCYGLYYKDELVTAISVGRRKITRGCVNWELLRFCTKQNTQIIGGLSKLCKHAIEELNISSLLSYCDLRYSTGKGYISAGFKYINTSPPNYWYTKDSINLLHRSNFQKHKINDGSGMTEREIMYKNGWRRLYDCGNIVLKYTVPNRITRA